MFRGDKFVGHDGEGYQKNLLNMLCKMIKIVGGNYHGGIANCPSVAELEEKRSKIVPYLYSTVQYFHHIHQR